MICPHCNKPIHNSASKVAKEMALELLSKGFSVRDIEKLLFKKGVFISYSSIQRLKKK